MQFDPSLDESPKRIGEGATGAGMIVPVTRAHNNETTGFDKF
jgi:hypothetical protein